MKKNAGKSKELLRFRAEEENVSGSRSNHRSV
jgi:hypothetical protein